MANETLIQEIENLLAEVVALGGANEQSKLIPNLEVITANPSGLDGFLIISDARDGDNILALKVGSVIYEDGDKVDVFFPEGGEAIAFQQGSQSDNPGNIWEITPNTSTDIQYLKGDVSIGDIGPPGVKLEVVDGGGTQLRLSNVQATVFADFTVDFGDDLTITPSSTGNVILQPTANSLAFFQVVDAAGDRVLSADSTNHRVGINNVGFTPPRKMLHVGDNNDAPGITTDGIFLARNGDTAFVIRDGTNNVEGYTRVTSSGMEFGSNSSHSLAIKTGNTDAIFIDTSQLVGIGKFSSLAAQVDIDQSSTTDAIPVISLDQGDVDEPFIKIIGEAASADLTRSIVDNGDVTTATLVGWYKMEVDDTGNQVTDGDYFQPFYSLV